LRRIFFTILFCCVTFPVRAKDAETQILDALVPGFGSFATDHPVVGSIFAFSRITTGYLAYYYREREKEYRSAANSAQIAELYYGPGYRFKNPYGGGYYNSAEFNREAGRREFFSNLAIVLNLGLTITSGLLTRNFLTDAEAQSAPVFPAVETKPQVRFSFRMNF